MDLVHAFIESYQNGFYQMQTPLETASAWLGNISYLVLHLFN